MIDSFRHVVLSGADLIGRYCGVQLKKINVFLWSGNEHYADHEIAKINVFVSNLVQTPKNDIFCRPSTPHVQKHCRFLSSAQFFIPIDTATVLSAVQLTD
jgi:hypothetical protein